MRHASGQNEEVKLLKEFYSFSHQKKKKKEIYSLFFSCDAVLIYIFYLTVNSMPSLIFSTLKQCSVYLKMVPTTK